MNIAHVFNLQESCFTPDSRIDCVNAAVCSCGSRIESSGYAIIDGVPLCGPCAGAREVAEALTTGIPPALYLSKLPPNRRNRYGGFFPSWNAVTWTGGIFGPAREGRIRRDSWRLTHKVEGSRGGLGTIWTIHPPDGSIWAGVMPASGDHGGQLLVAVRRVRPPRT